MIDIEFVSNEYFLQFGVPLMTVALSIFVKYVSRNDQHSGFRKEDLAVGLDISIAALLIFTTGSAKLAAALPENNPSVELVEKVESIPWILIAFLLGIWGISTLVRKLGWEEEDKLKVFWGILIPGFFGLLALLFAVNWIQ